MYLEYLFTRYYGKEDPRPADGWVCFPVSGKWRAVEQSVWDSLAGPKPPEGFVNDACSFSPDGWNAVRWWPACVIHDWHYSKSGPSIRRVVAEACFMWNLYTLARRSRWRVWKSLSLAAAYGKAVLVAGRPFFKRSYGEFA
jgi:hypothetical protein